MSNLEYTDLFRQFNFFREVLKEEYIPTTYKDVEVNIDCKSLIKEMEQEAFSSEQIIVPLSPVEGDLNYLDKNKLQITLQVRFNQFALSQMDRTESSSNDTYCFLRSATLRKTSTIYSSETSSASNEVIKYYYSGTPYYDLYSSPTVISNNDLNAPVYEQYYTYYGSSINYESKSFIAGVKYTSRSLASKTFYVLSGYCYILPKYTYFNTENNQIMKAVLGLIDPCQIIRSYGLYYNGICIYQSNYSQVECFANYSLLDNVQSSSYEYNFYIDDIVHFENCLEPEYLYSHLFLYFYGNSHSLAGYTYKPDYDNVNKINAYTVFTVNSNFINMITSSYDQDLYVKDFNININLSKLSPILSWLTYIPGFINKLELRFTLDSPYNCLTKRDFSQFNYYNQYITEVCNSLASNYINRPAFKTTAKVLVNGSPSHIKYLWLCKKITLKQSIVLLETNIKKEMSKYILSMGGKWLFPIRYWKTDIQNLEIDTSSENNITFSFQISGCYFYYIFLTIKAYLTDPYTTNKFIQALGNGIFCPPDIASHRICINNDLIFEGTNSDYLKYIQRTIPKDIFESLKDFSLGRFCLIFPLGPDNTFYQGKFLSNKVGIHNITWNIKTNICTYDVDYINAYCSILQDGMLVFSNFNGFVFNKSEIFQQVGEVMLSIEQSISESQQKQEKT